VGLRASLDLIEKKNSLFNPSSTPKKEIKTRGMVFLWFSKEKEKDD
jgi:hypothetical protein